MNFSKFFARGLNSTLRLLNGFNFSYKGPWVTVAQNTVVDTWYVGDFMSADYTISVDNSTGKKEIIKCLLVASPENASLTIYGRTDLNVDLVELTASVNNSKVTLLANPAAGLTGPNSKLIFSANYYQTVNELQP